MKTYYDPSLNGPFSKSNSSKVASLLKNIDIKDYIKKKEEKNQINTPVKLGKRA